jgi:hypothetical protein
LFCRTNYEDVVDVKIETDDKMSTRFAFKGLLLRVIAVQNDIDAIEWVVCAECHIGGLLMMRNLN